MNILWVTSDELRADCLGFMGNADIQTPNLDALAKRGAVFERHFTPFPKCVPARCAMHTGRYCHTDGLRSVAPDNHISRSVPTLASTLRGMGYETAIFGLNHIWFDDDFYGKGDEKNIKGGGVVDYTAFTGEKLTRMALQAREYPAGTPRRGSWESAFSELEAPELKTGHTEDFNDENRSDQAIYYLKELRDPAKPFFLQLNLSLPHPVYRIHEPWYSLYDPDTIRSFPHELPTNAPLPLRAQREHRTGVDFPPEASREIQAVYYGMVSFIDDQIGRLLRTVDALGLRENTLILFASDHGDYAGQHGLVEKWDSDLRDCLLHVPMVLAGPGVPGGKRISGLSEHIDLPATMLDFLGKSFPEGWVQHGSSLRPMLSGAPGKPAVFADGGHEASLRARFSRPVWDVKKGRRIKSTEGKQITYQLCPDAMAKAKMVRTENWKLVVRETGGNELYHLAADPWEMNNLYGQPGTESTVLDLQDKLLHWVLRTDTDLPRIADVGA